MNISLAGVLLFLLWTFCIIAVASERRSKESPPTVSQPEFEKLAVTTLERSSMRAPEETKRPSQITSIQDPKPVLQKRKAIRPKTSDRRSYLNQFNFQDAEKQALDEYDVREYARNKRFYPIEPGCIKGYVCCQNPYCRQFCSLCREEDVEDEAEKMLAEELERKKKEEEEKEKMLAEELERMKKEEEEKEKMLAEELERMKKEEEEKEKAEMEAQEQERKKMEAEEQDRKNKKNETKLSRGQLEFTHHIYEEYQPQFQAETKAPIILQTIPQYSISNYYSLSRHQHPTSLALTPFSNHAHSSSSSIPFPPQSPTPISPHSHHHHRHFSHSQHSFDSFDPHTIQNHVAGHHSSFGLEGQRHSNPTLFYEDIHPTSGLSPGSGTGPSAPPPMTHIANGRHHYKQHRYPKHLFDNPDEAPPLYVSSSAGSKPLADTYNFNPNHHHSLPQAQTVIYQDPPRHNTPAPAPPQPLLKYHLIRQSYPASGENKDYFAEIPAFLPGPPYLPQALPSRKTPVIQRPHRKRNRQGKLVALKGKKKKQAKSKQPKRKASRIGALVRNLLG
ncbi:uncharacterized protein LOC131881208 isoform X2 [Tigriopus californicus]|uniref:uncharacterized protein LOC131881208 isoform X2 n=1 Tax=Tigriopus californicus TaxID=6832 RepID=UPI0027DA59C7|nr:uncharacterized protein LOC131881208 isoform X2 [Tigriopus californicus]